jgi:hypothetical protein
LQYAHTYTHKTIKSYFKFNIYLEVRRLELGVGLKLELPRLPSPPFEVAATVPTLLRRRDVEVLVPLCKEPGVVEVVLTELTV